MTERAKNIAVGSTVIIALCLLGWMILIFTGLPSFLSAGYEIVLLSGDSYDIRTGDDIHFFGMRIGQISEVGFTDPANPAKGVTIVARISGDIRLPGNTKAYAFTKVLVGGAYIGLRADGPERIDPSTGEVLEFFPTDRSMSLRIHYVGASVIPPDIESAIKEISTNLAEFGSLARNLNSLFVPPSPTTGPVGDGATPASEAPIKATLAKLDRTLDGLAKIFGHEQNQDNLRKALAGLAEASAEASEVMAALKVFAARASGAVDDIKDLSAKVDTRTEQLTRKFINSADELSKMLMTINSIATRIESGEGTAGKLINDPKLYQNLLNVTSRFSKLLAEFQLLAEKWKQSGVGIKLK